MSITGNSELYKAVSSGEYRNVKRLLPSPRDINRRNNFGNTPLHAAIHNNRSDIVEILIEYGADILLTNIRNDTPLHIAAKEGRTKIVRLLIKYKANVFAIDNYQNIPLHFAIYYEHTDTAKVLIEHGGINKQNTCGHTPLHLAVMKKNKEIITELLTKGADDELTNSENKTPVDLLDPTVKEDMEIMNIFISFSSMLKVKDHAIDE